MSSSTLDTKIKMERKYSLVIATPRMQYSNQYNSSVVILNESSMY